MIKYFILQLKKHLRVLPVALGAMATLFICLYLGFNAISESSPDDSVRFKLAIVGSAEDGYLNAGLEIIQSYDSARFAVDTVKMSEDEAIEALGKGEIGAYVVIPDGYIRDAMSGHVGSLKYVSTTGAADLTALFKDEITSVVSDVIITCEKAMYGTEDALAANDMSEKAGSFIYDISLTYVDYILDRNSLYSVTELGSDDALGFDGYLFSGFVVLLLSVIMFPAAISNIKADRSIETLLKSKTVGSFKQVLGEFAAYSFIHILLAILLCIVASVIAEGAAPTARLANMISMNNFHNVLCVVLTLSSVSYLLSCLTDNVVSGVVVQFMAALVMCFLSGCLYPLYFFPESIQKLALFLPQNYCRMALAGGVSKEYNSSNWLYLIVFTTILFVFSAFVRSIKLRKVRG